MDEIFVCPKPIKWAEVYKELVQAKKSRITTGQDIFDPPKPLLLGGWNFSNDLEKQIRWKDTVNWAERNGVSNLIPEFTPDDCYYVSQISTYTVGPMGGPMYLPWHYEPREKPSKEEVATGFDLLVKKWEDIIGKEYSTISKPLGFSGKKRRRLKVGISSNTKSPWGNWSTLGKDESRRAFTVFRRRVNEIIYPLEVDHIDFEVMTMSDQVIEIQARDYWFKIIEMVQQNWALIEPSQSGINCIVHFIGDASGVFDQIEFSEISEAERQLRINGFAKYDDDKEAKQFIAPPLPPFHRSSHPNGAIYSSGRFWKSK